MNTENNYQATDLGNISPNPRSDYDASASYEYLDLVNMDGGSYICLAELGTTVTGISPEPGKTTETWQCIALPGDLTPEYIAMHDDVVNKAESVAEDTKNVTEMHENVTGMESNVQELQKQAAQSAEEAEASKDSAAGYARAADASRQSAEEAEANVNAQVTGFDSHVTEKTEESERAIAEARQAAVEVVHTATNTATNAAERAGSAASTAEEAKTAAAGSETNAAASASAAKTSETNAKASEEATKEAMQAAQAAAAGVAADREQIAALKKTKSSAIVQTATGTSIVAQDSSGDPVRGLRVFGKSTQDWTPSVENPVPIVNAGEGGSITVEVTGRNLLKPNSHNTYYEFPLKANTVMTLMTNGKPSQGGNIKFSVTDGSNVWFPIDAGQTRVCMSIGNKDVKGFYNLLVKGDGLEYMLAVGDIKTYTPYVEPQTLTLATPNGLPGIPVNDSSLANYTDESGQMWCSDEVDLERGVYVQRVKYINNIIPGYIDAMEHFCSLNINDLYENNERVIILSNRYKYDKSTKNDGICFAYKKIIQFYIDEAITTTEEMKEYFTNNPTDCIYPLATPIETPLTSDILSMYSMLHSNYLVTTVLNDAGAHMEFSYNADPKNYIAAEHAKMEAAFDAKLAEIIALLPAETQAAMIDNETTNLLNESEE